MVLSPDAGLALIVYLQQSFPWLAVPMVFVSAIGNPVFSFFIIAALYWCCDIRIGLRAALLLGISGGLNDIFKIAVHMPRPYWVSLQVDALAAESSFGFPSAHAQLAAGFWGLVAVAARRRPARAAALTLVLLIGFARVYLGVHFPADAIGGWLFGFLLLAAFLHAEVRLGPYLARQGVCRQVLLAFAGSLALPALALGTLALLRGWQVPPAWYLTAFLQTGEAIDPLTPAGSFVSAGIFFGFAAGIVLLRQTPCVLRPARRGRQLRRYLVGGAGILLLWFGFATAIVHAPEFAVWALSYARAALVGLWISAGAPLLFDRLQLAGEG